jgi:hypothetical protein
MTIRVGRVRGPGFRRFTMLACAGIGILAKCIQDQCSNSER